MERIKLSDFVNLILFLENQNRIRKSKTNNDLFNYINELVNLLDAVSMVEELKYLEDPLVKYLNLYSMKNKSYYFEQVNYEDLKMLNDTVFSFSLFFDKAIQNKYLYFPKHEKEFDQKLDELIKNDVGGYSDLNNNFSVNLLYSKEAYTLGLYNSSSLHLGIAVNIYFNYLFSKLVEREKVVEDKKDPYPNWCNDLLELVKHQDEIYIPENLIDLLHKVRLERNPLHHGEINYKLEETTKFIDRCFKSILIMDIMLIKNKVPKKQT